MNKSITNQELEKLALNVRERVVGLASDGGCFLGASLSCVDLLVALYKDFLRIDGNNLQDPQRDYLLLSKGHDVPALYGLFAELNWLNPDRLKNHLSTTDSIYWHPNRSVPGVEFHSGSLGHLLAVGAGIAYDQKLRGQNSRTVVIVGDGELNEGSNWEALLVASAQKLSNLLIVVDRNHFQANMRTEELLPLEPLQDKFLAFGAAVQRVYGHSFTALRKGLSDFPYSEQGPSVLIADTIRGKGLPSIEERADRWFCNFSQNEITDLLKELRGESGAYLESETLVVR